MGRNERHHTSSSLDLDFFTGVRDDRRTLTGTAAAAGIEEGDTSVAALLAVGEATPAAIADGDIALTSASLVLEVVRAVETSIGAKFASPARPAERT